MTVKVRKVLYGWGDHKLPDHVGWKRFHDEPCELSPCGWTRSYTFIEDEAEKIIVVMPRGMTRHPDGTDVIRYLEDLGIAVFVRPDTPLTCAQVRECAKTLEPLKRDVETFDPTPEMKRIVAEFPKALSSSRTKGMLNSIFRTRCPGDLLRKVPANCEYLLLLAHSADNALIQRKYLAHANVLRGFLTTVPPDITRAQHYASLLNLKESAALSAVTKYRQRKNLTIFEFEMGDTAYTQPVLDTLRAEARTNPRLYDDTVLVGFGDPNQHRDAGDRCYKGGRGLRW